MFLTRRKIAPLSCVFHSYDGILLLSFQFLQDKLGIHGHVFFDNRLWSLAKRLDSLRFPFFHVWKHMRTCFLSVVFRTLRTVVVVSLFFQFVQFLLPFSSNGAFSAAGIQYQKWSFSSGNFSLACFVHPVKIRQSQFRVTFSSLSKFTKNRFRWRSFDVSSINNVSRSSLSIVSPEQPSLTKHFSIAFDHKNKILAEPSPSPFYGKTWSSRFRGAKLS